METKRTDLEFIERLPPNPTQADLYRLMHIARTGEDDIVYACLLTLTPFKDDPEVRKTIESLVRPGLTIIGERARAILNGEQNLPDDLVRRLSTTRVRKKNKPRVDVSNYVQLPGTTKFISPSFAAKKNDWEGFHYELQSNGLYMANPDQFFRYFVALRDATDGDITLHYANGKEMPREQAAMLHGKLSRKINTPWRIYLDATFEERDGKLHMLSDHRIVDNAGGKYLKPTSDAELGSTTLRRAGLAELSFNAQGLPTLLAPQESYEPGININYQPPIKNRFAGVTINEGGAHFSCAWEHTQKKPNDSDIAFACFDRREE